MTDFRKIDDGFYASPQISVAEVSQAAAMGIGTIVNNRPEGEANDQPAGRDIEAATKAAGLNYVAIPIGHSGFSMPQVDAMSEVLAKADRPVLGFCRSGTRSTLLWSLAQAQQGRDPDEIAAAAEAGGYSIDPVRPTVDMLAGKSSD